MAVMTTNLCGSSRRTIQMLWLAAVLIFFAAVFHSSKLTPSRDWVGNTVQSMMRSSGRSSMKEHIRLAEASWAKTVKERHDLISADWETAAKMPLYPAQDANSYYKYPYTVWDFTPASWSCPHEMDRVGRMGDGGKWVCGMSQIEATAKTRLCVIYSFGVRDESSFEDEMLRRTKCEIWAYDFSVVDFGEQLQPEQRARAHFFQAGIARETDTAKNPPFYSIESLMEMNGHDYIDILKMDIEFAEFEAMDGLSYDFPASRGMELPIGQLLVEIHLFGGRITTEEYLDWWERLEARGLRPAWAEPNLLAVTLNNNGDKNPNMAEYVLINVRDSRSAIFGGAALAPQ